LISAEKPCFIDATEWQDKNVHVDNQNVAPFHEDCPLQLLSLFFNCASLLFKLSGALPSLL